MSSASSFATFSENGDFVKIELPLWREHNFEGSHPLKIDPESDFAWQQHQKTMESASDANSGRTFGAPGTILVDFSALDKTQNLSKRDEAH